MVLKFFFTSSSPSSASAKGDPEKDIGGLVFVVAVPLIVILLLVFILIVGMLILITLRKKKKESLLDVNSTVHSKPVYQTYTLVEGEQVRNIPLTNPVYGGNNYNNMNMFSIAVLIPLLILEVIFNVMCPNP